MDISAEFIEKDKHINHPALPVIEINQLSDNLYLSCSVLVYLKNEPSVILNIYSMCDDDGYILEQCFKEIKTNHNVVAVLHGMHVHLYDMQTCHISSIAFNDYVGHLYSIPDVLSDHLTSDFIVTTFEYVFLVSISGGIKWRSERCAIDGVVIYRIENGVIYGSGEWDPPGGWEPFTLDLSTGTFISQPPECI